MSLTPYTRELPVFDRWFDRPWDSRSRAAYPVVDVDSDDEGLIVRLEVPGIPPDALKVETHERTLVIRAEHESRAFARSLRLPADADVERIQAKLEHGVLALRIPKSEAAKPRQIEVKVH